MMHDLDSMQTEAPHLLQIYLAIILKRPWYRNYKHTRIYDLGLIVLYQTLHLFAMNLYQ